MNNRYQEDNEKQLVDMILETSNGKIPEKDAINMAKRIIIKKRYDDSNGKSKSIEKYIDDYIFTYFM